MFYVINIKKKDSKLNGNWDYTFYPHPNWYSQQNILRDMKFINVVHFTLTDFKVGV
jgi:hypothetical protein